jgi:predicted dehydrogenase
MRKIRFAVIGTSGIAPGHIHAIQNNPKAEVIYIYSRDIKRAQELAKHFKLIPTRTFEEILSDKTIDAIDIVTEPSRHAILALEAIKNGKHLLIEKPLDIDIVMAEKVMVAASKSPTLTTVISQKRFETEIINMKKELDNKKIGEPYLAEAKLFWKRSNEYYSKGNGWRGKEGNVLINQGIHWVDIAIWFFGLPTKIRSLNLKVKKEISCYDTAICCLEFSNNILFNLTCSTATHISQADEFKIYGTNGILDYLTLPPKTGQFTS